MNIHYINLKRRTDRDQLFLKRNHFINNLVKVDAIDGTRLDREQLIDNKIISPDLTDYSDGAIGCALSHLKLWELSIKNQQVITIAEDDAIFNRDFDRYSNKVLEQLPPDWDICLWGWNFDSILTLQHPENKQQSTMKFNQDELRNNVANFQKLKPDCKPLPMINAFGLMCYSISPKGAAFFIKHCFPLKNERVTISVSNNTSHVLNTSSDIAMNRFYAKAKSFACFPPLVASENYKADSDLYTIPSDACPY